MVKRVERKPLSNQLNLAEKELRWVEGRLEAKHEAIAEPFGDDRLASTLVMRTREFLSQNLRWKNVGVTLIAESIFTPKWRPVLEWLSGHPYALLVGDRQLAEQQEKREKIDIEYSLLAEGPKDWVGPHRYNPEISLFLQRNRAEEEGINCQVAVHVVAEALGHRLDKEERSGELFAYQPFDPTQHELEIGDVIFWHERPLISDPKSLHVTTYVGRDFAGVPLVLHATSQVVKSRPATEVIPITQLLTNRTKYCYGAVRLGN